MTVQHPQHFLLAMILLLATVVIVAGMRSFAGAWQARLRLGQDDGTRALGERAVAAMASELGEVRARLVAIETLLREVG